MSEIVQGSPEWFALRCGKVTASRIADLTATTKSGYSASRANYMAQLVSERLTGTPAEHYTNAAMQWGTEQEPAARDLYEFVTGQTVTEVGFVQHPTIAASGASPDGLVGEGLVEIKCPLTASHIDTLLGGGIEGKYVKQMQWQLACTGRRWCDFVSFDPRLPGKLAMFVKRIERDQKMISEFEVDVVLFLAELDKQVDALRRLM